MLPLTLNQAASACHKSKAALLQAIRTGRLSAVKGDTGQWEIQPAELFRVYPVAGNLPGKLPGNENRDQPPISGNVTPVTSNRLPGTNDAERERKQYEDRIADLKETIADYQARLTRYEDDLRQLRLTHQQEINPEVKQPGSSATKPKNDYLPLISGMLFAAIALAIAWFNIRK